PTISVNPSYPVFVEGEEVKITCESSGRVYTFHLHNSKYRLYYENVKTGYSHTFTHIIHGAGDQGNYYCKYSVNIRHEWQDSPFSAPLQINVADSLPDPSLSLSPMYPVFVKGEEIQIICLVSRPGATCRLYRNGQYLAYKYAATGECCCNFTLSAIEDGDHGNYFCQYSISLQGRWKYSPLSTSVEIKVTDSLPDPSLSLSPAYPAFVNGEETQITCLASHLGARCELYGNGQSLYYKEAAAREYNCNFTLTIKGDGDQGNYSCLYSIYSHGRWISSSYSISVEIKVTESLPAPNTSIIPEQSVFVKGEEANITCSASR
uniref:Ig-like domain-containing protein n=1 Tax=Latimeria chalumnae TaxID=7897 RepID=H2ZTV1_LATCH